MSQEPEEGQMAQRPASSPTQRLTLPGTGRGGYACVPGAVLEALDVLEIRRPVVVKLVGASRIGGNYHPVQAADGSVYHEVHLRTDSSPEKASGGLWHELQHAAQCERFETPKAFIQAYGSATAREGGGRVGYFNNPFEQEARSTADLMADERLTRPATR